MTDFGTATLDIEWPKETANGKRLLYLMKISSTGVDQIECTPKGEINPEKVSGKTPQRMGGVSDAVPTGDAVRETDIFTVII